MDFLVFPPWLALEMTVEYGEVLCKIFIALPPL